MSDEKDKKNTPEATPPAEGAKNAKDAGAKEEAAPKDAAAAPAAKKPASAGSPWLPVLAVIIVLPVLSFVMTESVMIPRVKKALGDIAAVQQQNALPAHGGPAPLGGHGEAKKEKKEKKESGGHGGGGHGEKAGAGDKEAGVKFENVVANLSGSMKSRFLKVSFVIEGDEDDFKDIIGENKTKIIDTTLGVLGALSAAELDEPGMKNIVRSDLIDAMNQSLQQPLVKRLYFSEFVIQ